jgi:hypothetical protein
MGFYKFPLLLKLAHLIELSKRKQKGEDVSP